jgi:hypothetical protein
MHLSLHPSREAIIVSEAVDSVFSWLVLFERESDAKYIMSEFKSGPVSSLRQFMAFIQTMLGPEARFSLFPLRHA